MARSPGSSSTTRIVSPPFTVVLTFVPCEHSKSFIVETAVEPISTSCVSPFTFRISGLRHCVSIRCILYQGGSDRLHYTSSPPRTLSGDLSLSCGTLSQHV